MKEDGQSEFIVVGVGASNGGIHALKRFLSNLKLKNAAIVIIQHMNASDKKFTIDLLHKVSDYPVDEVVQGAKICPGHIYLCPSDLLVSIEDETFVVQSMMEAPQKFATIDWFFDSLAKNFKENSVGVILSGEGIDGTLGLKTISESGGLTLAQDEKSSEYPSMPHHARELGIVDHIIAPENMSAVIATHENFVTKLNKSARVAALHEEIGASVISICEILLRHTHHDFKHYKTSTLVRRIQRRMLVLQAETVDEYVEVLGHSPTERENLFNDLLINVTSFFRDPEAFDALKNDVLAKMLPQVLPTRKYRIWVAGCSTGEEAYTMAIIAREILEEQGLKGEVQIIATDIDEDALNIARKGEYPLSIVDRITPARLEKYFQRRNNRFIVSRGLREMILFSSHNLINDPPFSQLDLISCRNVLIYLGMHLQKKLIPVFHYALRQNGYLFLGTSEALGSHKDLFATENLKYRIAQRKQTAINHPPHSFLTAMSTTYSGHFKEAPQNQEEDLLLIGQRIVLDEFAPKFAIINDDLQILTLSSGFNDFLEPGEGSFQNNITKLVKQNLRAALRSSISEAKKHKRQIQNYSSFLPVDKGLQKIGIVVQPMPQLGGHTGLYMVVFKDQGIISEDSQDKIQGTGINVEMMEELEKELANLRSDLDRSVQDLEASNEELKSSNEELLSMNEELQSANEELEISKEEIQRSNDALLNANVDLENFLNSTKIATIFLDDKLNIKNFTPAINELYDLVPHDVGRSITNFTSKALKMPKYSFPKDLKPDQIVETEVIMPDGKIFLRRKSPYMNKERKQVGLVVTFIDVTELRRSEDSFKALANALPQMIFTTDDKGNYVYFSEQWLEFSGIDPGTVKNKGFREIVHPDDIAEMVKHWTDALENKEIFNHEFRFKDKFGKYHWHLVRARAQKDVNGMVYRWFGTCTNIQQHKELVINLEKAQVNLQNHVDQLKVSDTRYEMASRATRELIWDWDLVTNSVLWNEALVKQLGYKSEDLNSNADWWYEHIHPEDRERVVHSIHEVIDNNGQFWNDQYRFRFADGNYAEFLDQGFIHRNDEGKADRMIGSMKDITEQKIYINKINEAINARDEFLSVASHELKTPLTSMILKIQMLQRQLVKDGDHTDKINKTNDLVLKQCRLLTSLIDDMLDVSRIATGRMTFNMQTVNLHDVVTHAIEVFSVNLEHKNVRLNSFVEDGLIFEGDAFRIEQVVYNLLSNALKYGLDKPISISLRRVGNEALIEVEDQGMGIPMDKQERIFKRFERAVSSNDISGLGLGLYISKEIVDAHNGKISVESKVGIGSKVTVRLSLNA